MRHRSLLVSMLALLSLAAPAVASAAPRVGAVVFSRTTTTTEAVAGGGEPKLLSEGGLFAVRDGRLNQLTENPADTEPDFSPDGTAIAFVREGHVFSVRADGSGLRQLTRGPAIDSAPKIAPNGRYFVFERREAAGAPAHLYTERMNTAGLHELTEGSWSDGETSFSPDGKLIVFVRRLGAEDELFSVRPGGAGLRRLTRTRLLDEFAPRYFAGGIVFSRGKQAEGAAAYADVYTMRRNGTRVKPLVRGAGSASVEDVSPDGRTLLFRRAQGLWVKPLGRRGPGRKLCELPVGLRTNSVFSSDGRRVAAFLAGGEGERLVSIGVARGDERTLAEGVAPEEGGDEGSSIGPVISWQPVR